MRDKIYCNKRDERLKVNYQAFDEDEELPKSFRGLFKESGLNYIYVSRSGANYLRQNKVQYL